MALFFHFHSVCPRRMAPASFAAGLKPNKSDEAGKHQAKKRKAPDVKGAGLDVVFDCYIRHARAQKDSGRHGAEYPSTPGVSIKRKALNPSL